MALADQIIAESQELGTLSPTTPTEPRRQVGKQVGAGVDLGQALLQRGGQAFLEAFGEGDSEMAGRLRSAAEKNLEQAGKVEANDLFDQVLQGFGTLGVGASGAAVGAAAGVVSGVSLPLAATAGGLVTSLGLSEGELQQKVLELDPTAEADLSQIVLGAGPAALEVLPIMRFKKAFEPLTEAVKAQSKSQIAGETLKDIGETALLTGATEATQDLGTSLAAHAITNTEIDSDRIDQLVSSAVDEALVGAILGVPVGGIQTVAKRLNQSQAAFDEGRFVKDDQGNIVGVNTPVADSIKQPGLVKQAASKIMGRAPDQLLTKYGGVKSVRDVMSNFVQNPAERPEARARTIEIDAQLKSAEMLKDVEPFLRASQKDQEAAVEARSKGIAPESEGAKKAAQALSSLFDTKTKEMASKAGISDDINWRDNTYLPLLNADFKKITADPQAFVDAAIETAQANELDVKKVGAQARAYAENLTESGFYNYGQGAKSGFEKSIVDLVERAEAELATGEISEEVSSRLDKRLGSVDVAQVSKNNPLEQERFLSELPQEFWNNWTKGDPSSLVLSYVRSTSERLAHAERFGANNERYYAQVKKSIADTYKQGGRMTPQDLKRFVDVIHISQRLPTRQVDLRVRNVQDKIRAYQNITKLPLAIIPSLAETLLLPFKFGVKNTFTAFGNLVSTAALKTARKAIKGIPKNRHEILLDDLGISFREAMNVMSNRLGEDTFSVSALEQGFFNLTGLPQFTEFLRMSAALSAEKSIIEDLGKLVSQKASVSEQKKLVVKLSEAGLDPAAAMDWFRDGASRKSDYYMENVRPALLNLVEDTVINPSPIQRPIWTSDERFRLVAQLKSFATVFTNRIMREWLNQLTKSGPVGSVQAAAKLLPFLATFIAAQVYLGALREFVKTGDTENWDDQSFMESVINGASMLGGVGFVTDSIRADSFGRDAFTALAGPSAGDFSKLAAGIGDILSGDLSPEEVTEVIMTTPFRAFPGSQLIRETIEDAI